MKYLIGNWKANKTTEEARTWIQRVKREALPPISELKVVLCPAFTHLPLFKSEYPGLTLGAQDLSPYADGAYTGEVTARMLKDVVDYTILGHSERRRYFHETETTVAQKVRQALDNALTPIIAVDKDNWHHQLNALEEAEIRASIIMYEPPEAISAQIGPIGKGKPAPLKEVKEMIAKIKDYAPPKALLYGGSVKSHNLATFLNEPTIDGVLPGSASLNPEEWLKMIDEANRTLRNTAADHG